jgi:zona occludens toxin
MAMTVYSGLQGHGKSYEFVRSVVAPNIAKGRRVVTNVAGLKIEAIHQYCITKLQADPLKLGEIVQVSNEQVVLPNFFPKENQDNAACVVQGGDIVGLDECWRWYVTGEQLDKNHLTFFRMHRHFTHPETGQACDVVLIVQAIQDLQRKVLATVEKSYLMQKHKDLGMPNRYVVGVYSGNRQTDKALIEQFQSTYSPEIFELYSSYSQSSASTAKEDQADTRGNVFNRKMIKFGLPIALMMIFGAFYFSWRFFHPEQKKETLAQTVQDDKSPAPVSHAKYDSEISDKWRVVGSLTRGAEVVFVLSDESQRLRYVSNPPGYKFAPGEIELALPSGEIVTRWSGSSPSGASPGMSPK